VRPSASKSAGLARSAPARNEKPRFADEDVATLSDQDRWPATDVRVSVTAQGPQCREGRCESPSLQASAEPLSHHMQHRRHRCVPLADVACQPERRWTPADLPGISPCATNLMPRRARMLHAVRPAHPETQPCPVQATRCTHRAQHQARLATSAHAASSFLRRPVARPKRQSRGPRFTQTRTWHLLRAAGSRACPGSSR
jgi:hypothetical protein